MPSQKDLSNALQAALQNSLTQQPQPQPQPLTPAEAWLKNQYVACAEARDQMLQGQRQAAIEAQNEETLSLKIEGRLPGPARMTR